MITFIALLIIAILAGALFWYRRRQAAQPAAKPLPVPAPAGRELPAKYGKDEVVLMVKDPYWLYAYWELSDAKKEELKRRFGPGAWEKSRPLLRVYDLTNHPYDFLQAPFFEIAITDMADNWYIHTGKPSSTFCVDLGRWFPEYGFVTIARSNIVTTPADKPSSVIDPLWPPLEACWQAVERYGKAKGFSSIQLVKTQK
ncbi:MAG: uncharacterized protein PWR22_481 [Moorella sp. (in: firmicutes)]|jgi:hypothetical protein|uniref:DUF4912 domain-containing protein n=1 Tax=Moorella sp. E308F TaxID=2572682 RepID=UPI0010FFC63C|nr:DUF4912 domain-containing protein [Moorella sp. E308F]MDK2815852.1 uncharacterized protein [Moorella sp. (in: firmicutes)]MDK2893899.1 uncharacterized protein [Moorella sp. (in: firmicutes)]GEA13855.1 DUF4912 domain-containing protein [Moorella sp. E308F]